MGDVINTARLRVLLTERHQLTVEPRGSSPWVLFFELRNGTGFGRRERYLDALAMHTWPSKGFVRIAYELKCSRSDWLRELAQPEKRRWGMEISHEFWFVVARGVVTDIGEVPEGCGLLVATEGGDKLIARKQATHRDARPLEETEVAAIARKAMDREVFARPAWRYAGRTLDEDGLRDVVLAHMDRVQESEVERRAQARAEELVAAWRRMLAAYSAALSGAGIAPPRWMDPQWIPTRDDGSWQAQRWVDTVRAPPGGQAVCDALRRLESLELAIAPAREALAALRGEDDDQE